ncbi:nitrate reductase gamma subunit [Bathymodiolus platifrons methanotrophic gill symbiont]|uniref:respiratory nitrate reductase subunit gamma n=1 Tax=Bathymodiolus platifrons methanotrophic gill symbiont TaxID=113268 RepID=UPI000B41F1AA|nr:respiratory nitrate reductase subunit gamma [Bathymodiolus platifrons methanotrophic gill symbiont]MCK5869506.1 respiratory nitrate reductase subunit gamma [Methyloprofundus sp.]TXK97313.1 respiratory nitrate reductase subunit gamma [Methylococcaceae bacterium CS4]TXK99188.1 respiratory nitrate reductase subunit gamma [Methylococcaceae bacterium CS5]TXL08608.1 respiratory nitrate reductase subunit gamma [Methylococcaceae bacterium CS1]TXL08751.1 respiratory nitrate reductase subunit gamma [
MNLSNLLFGVYPYIALTTFLVGSVIRFDREQYTWKADSSQIFEKEQLQKGSILFHIGVLALFMGHFAGLVTPHSWFLAMGVSDMMHQIVAISAGAAFGSICMMGGVILWKRRMYHPRVRANSRFMDLFILNWILVTLGVGLLTIPVSIYHAFSGDTSAMIALADWAQATLTLNANSTLLANVGFIYKLHLFLGMSVFFLFPFSRLVHVWSMPLGYMFRPYQIVRTKFVKQR